MALVQEGFDGGLVTVRDASMLREGELQQCDDCIYRPFDPAIHRAPGRTAYNSTALGSPSAVKGLAYLSFDNNDDVLLSYIGTGLNASAFTATTGTFTSLATVGSITPDSSTDILNTVKYGDSYFTLHNVAGLPGRPRYLRYTAPFQSTTASCALGATTTVTTSTTNGFALVTAGQTVTVSSGTGTLASGTTVASVTDNLTIVLSAAPSTTGTATLAFSGTPALAARYAGLDPVRLFGDAGASSAAIIAGTAHGVAVTTGVWNTTLDVGYYWFLITEAYIPTLVDDVANGYVESGFTGTPQRVHITNVSTQAVALTFPVAVNNGASNNNSATHFIIYMSASHPDPQPAPALNTFTRIASPIPITSLTAMQTFTVTTSSTVDQGFSGAGALGTVTAVGTSAFTNTSRILGTPNQTFTTRTSVGGAIAVGTYGFVASGDYATASVTGVEVLVHCTFTPVLQGVGAIAVRILNKNDTTKVSPTKKAILGSGYVAPLFGGATDKWNVAWAVSDFTDTNFQVEVFNAGLSSGTLGIDSVLVRVHYSGIIITTDGVPFSTITYRSQIGTSVTDTTNLPPRAASTGDVFQGQVVTNDLAQAPLIRYSLPDRPEYFPLPYFLLFNTAKKDKVTFIKTLGQVLIVGLVSSLKRVNYLPRETDTEFEQGIAQEDLTTDHGIVGPMAGCLFDMPSGGPMLAYVSYKGIHMTDGVTSRFLNVDLDWTNTVDLTNLGTCILRNYSALNLLVLFYPPTGGSGANTKALAFSYSPDKIKSGGHLPAVGPISVSARSATEAVLSGVPKLLTGHVTDGKVYLEDSGTSDASGGTLIPIIRTRLIYPGGLDRDVRQEKIYIRCAANGQTLSISSTTTAASTTCTSSAAFGSVVAGMYVYGTGIVPGTIVTAKATSSSLTLSQAADTSGTSTLSFTDGTLSVSVRGQNIRESIQTLETTYQSTEVGGLILLAPDNQRQSLELKIAKVVLPSTSAVDLSTAMRLSYWAYDAYDGGPEANRSTS